MGKDLNLDEILSEYSGKKGKSSDLNLDDLDISFKKESVAANNNSELKEDDVPHKSDVENAKSSSAVMEKERVSDDKDLHIDNTPGDTHLHEKNQEKPENSLKLHFGGADETEKTTQSKEKKSKVAAKDTKGKKKKKSKKKKVRFNGSIFGGIIIVTIILTVSMLIAVEGISIGMEYYGIGKSDNDISFNIPEGSSNDKIADLLVENGIIKNKKLFLIALKIHKPDVIYPGDITLQPSMGYADVIEALKVMRESYESVKITFTEGETLVDIAAKLEENGVCTASDFLFEFNKNQNYSFESDLTDTENAFYAREGYFFPDTYEFYVGDTAYNITKIVREHFEKQLTEKMYNRMDKLGLDLNQVMTLASIVQLEANSVDEMPTVASVFLNRLNDPDTYPRLESDTTDKYIKNVISKQTENQSTIDHYTDYYDTYQCKGLPAGPICNPGLDAIMAVLYPEDTDYYFFCNNLETGESFYAKTLKEHEKNLVKAGLAEEEKE